MPAPATPRSPSAAADPFIAWTCLDDWMAPSAPFRGSCEKHLRTQLAAAAPIPHDPAIEGVIVYDKLERGAAVAVLLGREGRTLPRESGGEFCDTRFDEQDLCDQTNAHGLFARIHQGARGMLVTLREDESRRLLLLDQRHVGELHPMSRNKDPEGGAAATGLLAHELAHARDYADGRPGRPSRDEIAARCRPEHVDALHAIADMALAEYVATRAECAKQVSTHGACASGLAQRAGEMARRTLSVPPLAERDLAEGDDPEQRRLDLSQTGYVIGTLAAYADARAPIFRADGTVGEKNTADQVRRHARSNPALSGLVRAATPALRRAAENPDRGSRESLAHAMERALVLARTDPERTGRRARSAQPDFER